MIQPKDGREGRFSRPWAVVAGIGIVAVAGIETYALSQGINGSALTASLSAIAGLAARASGGCCDDHPAQPPGPAPATGV